MGWSRSGREPGRVRAGPSAEEGLGRQRGKGKVGHEREKEGSWASALGPVREEEKESWAGPTSGLLGLAGPGKLGLARDLGWVSRAVLGWLGFFFFLPLFFLKQHSTQFEFKYKIRIQALSLNQNKTMHQHECTNMF